MRSVNDGIAFFAADLEPSDSRWLFICECGLPECVSWIELELSEYEEIRADDETSVLAGGHVASPVRRARAEATELREAARALRGQAQLQRDRAASLLGEPEEKQAKPQT